MLPTSLRPQRPALPLRGSPGAGQGPGCGLRPGTRCLGQPPPEGTLLRGGPAAAFRRLKAEEREPRSGEAAEGSGPGGGRLGASTARRKSQRRRRRGERAPSPAPRAPRRPHLPAAPAAVPAVPAPSASSHWPSRRARPRRALLLAQRPLLPRHRLHWGARKRSRAAPAAARGGAVPRVAGSRLLPPERPVCSAWERTPEKERPAEREKRAGAPSACTAAANPCRHPPAESRCLVSSFPRPAPPAGPPVGTRAAFGPLVHKGAGAGGHC